MLTTPCRRSFHGQKEYTEIGVYTFSRGHIHSLSTRLAHIFPCEILCRITRQLLKSCGGYSSYKQVYRSKSRFRYEVHKDTYSLRILLEFDNNELMESFPCWWIWNLEQCIQHEEKSRFIKNIRQIVWWKHRRSWALHVYWRGFAWCIGQESIPWSMPRFSLLIPKMEHQVDFHICYANKYLALKTSLHRGWAQSTKISIHHFRCSNNTC